MTRNSDWPLPARTSSSFFWPGSGDIVRSRSATPSMPFMGVRISWLIIARNDALARVAASAVAAWASACARASRILHRICAAKRRRYNVMAPAPTDMANTTANAAPRAQRIFAMRASRASITISTPSMATTLPARSRTGANALK